MLQIVAQRQGFVFTNPPVLVPNIGTLFKKTAAVLANLPAEEHVNLYYTLAHHSGVEGASKPQRSGATFEYQTVLAFDIDGADTSRPLDYANKVAEILKCPTEALIVVCSGNGIHCLCHMRHPIRQAKFFKDHKAAYSELCDKILRLMVEADLPGKLDRSIFEPARVLRLPGTKNVKPDKEDKPCTLVQYSDTVLDINLGELSGLGDLASENVSPQDVRRNYPRPDFPEIYKECGFVQWATKAVDEVHEPHAFDLFSLLVNMPPADKIELNGQEMTAIELGEHVFKHAKASRSLARSVFEDKWSQSAKYGCRKCETISHHFDGCKTCPHYGKIATPLALKSDEHIGSEGSGYWVIDSKGKHAYPHYGDLAKVFKREHSYVTLADERLLSFTGTHYLEAQPLRIKSWLERRMIPTDPLRENHRNEFVAKVKVVGALSNENEDDLFLRSIKGKVNCANGVLDILTGELLPHSPTIGFRNVLPYEYIPEEASEPFLDWLAEITLHRTEIMDAVLDMMAYCLWPSYDVHKFFYLVGEGANGKSTLIHIIQAIVGRDNYSSASIHQLSGNRFAPAVLEGKMVNLSEESGGSDLYSEQLDIIKNLSAGGEMFIEQKNKQGYMLKNKAKLIFSANKVPRFHENGEAMTRRLVAIPFDYRITNPDHGVEEKLISEVPKILSMLVRRIQKIVKAHHGTFFVSTGGYDLVKAQEDFLSVGDSVVVWAREAIESSAAIPEDQYIPISDAYAHYRQWCEENGYRNPQNKNNFSKSFIKFVLTPAVAKGDTRICAKESGQWVTRHVYKRTKFKETRV